MPSETQLDHPGVNRGGLKSPNFEYLQVGWNLGPPRGPHWGLFGFFTAYSSFPPQAGSRHKLAFPVANFIICVSYAQSNKLTMLNFTYPT